MCGWPLRRIARESFPGWPPWGAVRHHGNPGADTERMTRERCSGGIVRRIAPGLHRVNAVNQAPSFGTVCVSSATQMFFVSM